MNEKEIGELRRRLRPDKCEPEALYGCLVNGKKEIVSGFRQSLALTPTDDREILFGLLRKTLTGGLGKNLLDIPFRNGQVLDSDEYRMFYALRAAGEQSEEAIRAFFDRTAAALEIDGPYLILLLQDRYGVRRYSKDGRDDGEGDEVFCYCIGAVCPVKETKPQLSFTPSDNVLRSLTSNGVVAPPELGFLFPSFDDRSANVYDLLYYAKRSDELHPEFLAEVVRAEPPMPAGEQQAAFQDAIEQTLGENCSLEVAMALRDAVCEEIENAKENEDGEPAEIGRDTVSRVLRDCGVEETRVEAFNEAYQARFGSASLPPANVVNTKQIEISTPDVQIRVRSDRSDLISARVIDGVRYLLIRAESYVDLGGMQIRLPNAEE